MQVNAKPGPVSLIVNARKGWKIRLLPEIMNQTTRDRLTQQYMPHVIVFHFKTLGYRRTDKFVPSSTTPKFDVKLSAQDEILYDPNSYQIDVMQKVEFLKEQPTGLRPCLHPAKLTMTYEEWMATNAYILEDLKVEGMELFWFIGYIRKGLGRKVNDKDIMMLPNSLKTPVIMDRNVTELGFEVK